MSNEILVFNSGASSVRAALFDGALRRFWSAHVDRVGRSDSTTTVRDALGSTRREQSAVADHDAAIAQVFEILRQAGAAPSAIGHRLVHGGESFDAPTLVTAAIEQDINGLSALAPMHMPANLRGLAAARRAWPQAAQIACFDTAFHTTMPQRAQMTALPAAEAGLAARRFGFHGLSYEYIVGALAAAGVDVAAERIIIAHLGAGASLCAVKEGRSIETTMGFSTLSGLPMSTRCGDVDAGALLYLLIERGLAPHALQLMLYERSGLAALAQGDMQDLLARRGADTAAAFAIEYFCYQARRHLGALAASLGGLDRLVFTGGIGANAAAIREGICADLHFLGVDIDRARNEAGEALISAQAARVAVEVMATDEEGVIARHVAELMERGARASERSRSFPGSRRRGELP
jgi:acetate kinase